MSRWALALCASMLAQCAGATGLAPPGSGGQTPQTAQVTLAARLKPVYLAPSLFTPDHWWTYDGTDLYERTKARFSEFILAQSGFVSIGRKSVLNSGARVTYGVTEFGTVEEAERALAKKAAPDRQARNVRRSARELQYGDGGHDVTLVLLNAQGVAQSVERRAYVRWSRWIVSLVGSSNMRAFGPRPKSGERPWLHEAVFRRAFVAAMRLWRDAKELSPAPQDAQPTGSQTRGNQPNMNSQPVLPHVTRQGEDANEE